MHPKDDRLPVPSTTIDVASAMAAPTNASEDRWVLGLVTELDKAIKAMHVGDMGEVVTELPELDFSIRAEL